MTIKEVENQTGLARSNVRFYEKERLIDPARNESNGYREYSEKDVEDIKKIAYLRTLGISIEDIRSVISGRIALYEAVKRQKEALEEQMTDLQKAKTMCERMLTEENISYADMQVEQYVTGLQDYWKDNQPVFRLDSVSFLYLWGSSITWLLITLLCLAIGVLSYAKLPPEIPIQWSDGMAVSLVDRKVIFAYPVVCAVIRYLIRPYLFSKLQTIPFYREMITEYLTNYFCFLVLSVEVFTVLFVYGVVKNVVVVLLVDTMVLIGLLAAGVVRAGLRRE